MHFNVILMMLLLLFASPVYAKESEKVPNFTYYIEVVCIEGHVFWSRHYDIFQQLMTQSKDGIMPVPVLCDTKTFKNKTIVFHRQRKTIQEIINY